MKKFVVRILFIFSTLLVFAAFSYWSYQFLSVHHPIKSDNYLIEGWVQAYDIEEAVNLIKKNDNGQVYVVGQNFISGEELNSNSRIINPLEPIPLLANGSILIFPDNHGLDTVNHTLTLTFVLKGSKAKDIFSHVSIAVDGRFIQSFFASDEKKEYKVTISTKEKLEWISISFDNDLYTKKEDRNLFLYGISLGNDQLDLTKTGISITHIFTKKNTGFSSSAEHMANYISDLGIDPIKVHSINFYSRERNQTYNGAMAFHQVNDSLNLTSFNVISSGIHSRRTWKTYQRLFEARAEVGVFYFKPMGYNEINWYKKPQGYVQLFEELVELIANEFYSSPDS